MITLTRKKILIGGAAGLVIILAAVAGWMWFRGGSGNATAPAGPSIVPSSNSSGITNVVLNRSAYETALSRVVQWERDAVLMKMSLADASGSVWDFIFVSPGHKGQGLAVVVSGGSVASASPESISGGGTPLPANLVSPDDAMAIARSVPGFASVPITAVQLIYVASAKQWYWGVGNAKGTSITIKATP